MLGFGDDRPDDTQPPDEDGYILCDECSSVALDGLRSWIEDTTSRSH